MVTLPGCSQPSCSGSQSVLARPYSSESCLNSMPASTRQAAMPNTRKKMAEIQAIAPFMKPTPSLAFFDALGAAVQSRESVTSSRLHCPMQSTQRDGWVSYSKQPILCSSCIEEYTVSMTWGAVKGRWI